MEQAGRTFHLNKLKAKRKDFAFSQEQVRTRLGLNSRTLLSNWEQGYYLPSIQNLFALSHLYQCSPLDLYPNLNTSVIKKLKLIDNKLFEEEQESEQTRKK